MDEFTTLCTKEQTLQASSLGAPISKRYDYSEIDTVYGNDVVVCGNNGTDSSNRTTFVLLKVPTAEQMIAWLDTKDITCDVFPIEDMSKERKFACRISKDKNKFESNCIEYSTRAEATIGVIDDALDYLEITSSTDSD